jgi:hypothetical protein
VDLRRWKKGKKREGKEKEKEGRKEGRTGQSQIHFPKETRKLQKKKNEVFLLKKKNFDNCYCFEMKLRPDLRNPISAIKRIGWWWEVGVRQLIN